MIRLRRLEEGCKVRTQVAVLQCASCAQTCWHVDAITPPPPRERARATLKHTQTPLKILSSNLSAGCG